MQNNPQLNNIQLDENGQVIPTLQGKVSQNWYNRLVDPIINVANKYQNWADTNRSNIENLPRDNQLNNLGLGLSNIGQQYIDMTAHPIQTIQGAGYALTHLPETTNAMYDKLVNGTVDYFSNPQAMYENPAYPLEQINDVAGIALAGKGLGQLGKASIKQLEKPISNYINDPNYKWSSHGSPFEFKEFSQAKAGTGEAANVHGSGAAYTAQLEEIANKRYANRLSKQKGTNPHLYRVRQASNKNMLDESKPFNQQPQAVKDSIRKMANEGNELAQEFIEDDFYDGRMFYNNLAEEESNIRSAAVRADRVKGLQEKELNDMANNMYDFKGAIISRAFNKGVNPQDILNQLFGEGTNSIESAWDKFKQNPMQYADTLTPADKYSPALLYNGLFDNSFTTTIGDQLNASNKLYNQGIKGIQYVGDIDGNANVIFNPKDATIMADKYGNWYNRLKYNLIDAALKRYHPDFGGTPTGGAASLNNGSAFGWGFAGSSNGATGARA